MPTVRDQIKLEQDFMKRSADKYYAAQDKLRAKRQNDQTDSSRYVIKQGILDAANILEDIVENKVRGIGAQYNQLVKIAASRVNAKGELYYDYNSVVYMALTVLFRALGSKNSTKFTYLKATLSSVLEADAKARLFEAAYPGYYFTVMKSMTAQGVTKYEHIHKVIMTKFRHFEIQWSDWNIHETNAVSQKIFNAILVAMPTIFFKNTYKERNKSVTIIDTTVEADEWFAEYEKERGLVNPSLPPMIIPPLPWSADEDGNIVGGYTTPRMCLAVPFVKATDQQHKEFIRQHIPTEHISAINKMQNTAWKINTKIYEVQRELFKSGKGGNSIPRFMPKPLLPYPESLRTVPVELLSESQQGEVLEWKIATKAIHTENRLNKAKVIAYKMTFDGASDYRHRDQFYFVYNTDFRGRVYCATSGLSPQGNDISKALLHFADGVEIGESGLRWLAIHGANTFGNDKVSNDDRVKWCISNEDRFRAVAERPLDTTEYWGSADKPWQFLAFIFEWARTGYGRDKTYLSTLPIGLDGSCNGIQHYSAILRDYTGGSGVNLRDGILPSDIYQDVANELIRLLKLNFDGEAIQWLEAGITRKLTKRPVMTLPYGSTQQSARKYILEWIMDQGTGLPWPDTLNQQRASYLTPLLWSAIANVVVASRSAMVWLQRCSTKVLKEQSNLLRWLSPAGFPVYQAYYKSKAIVVDTMMMGDIMVNTPDGNIVQNSPRVKSSYLIPTKDIDKTQQRSGIAPNFIHSIDASHMVKTINACDGRVQSFAMIHDDFGTHAGNTQYLWEVIRQQFHKMYIEHEPLKEWFEFQGLDIDPKYPPMGKLDIDEVLTSTYFFG